MLPLGITLIDTFSLIAIAGYFRQPPFSLPAIFSFHYFAAIILPWCHIFRCHATIDSFSLLLIHFRFFDIFAIFFRHFPDAADAFDYATPAPFYWFSPILLIFDDFRQAYFRLLLIIFRHCHAAFFSPPPLRWWCRRYFRRFEYFISIAFLHFHDYFIDCHISHFRLISAADCH